MNVVVGIIFHMKTILLDFSWIFFSNFQFKLMYMIDLNYYYLIFLFVFN
jgi:hypothetical protein